MDFSSLRPRGAVVHRSNSISSGVVPFMSMWNAMCDTIMSAGTRRGAMMATLRCLSGNTLISTLKGRVPLKELVGQNPYLYCTDGRKVYVRQATAVVSNGVRKTVRIRFDD